MKRSFLLVFLLWISIGGGVIAQNRSIRFEPKDWKIAVEKARRTSCYRGRGCGIYLVYCPGGIE